MEVSESSNIRSIDSFRYSFESRLRKMQSPMRDFELADTRHYLENPTKKRIWYLQEEWIQESTISLDIWKELSPLIDKKYKFKIAIGKRHINVELDPKDRDDYKEIVFNRISFIIFLFRYASLINQETSEHINLRG